MAEKKSKRGMSATRAAGSKSKSKSKGKAASAKSSGKRGSGKRDLVKTPTATLFARRDSGGKFREMDEVGRSLAADRRQTAKTKVKAGYGDRGDRS